MNIKTTLIITAIIIALTIIMYENNLDTPDEKIVEESGEIIVLFCDINNCTHAFKELIDKSENAKCAFYAQKEEILKKSFEKINYDILIYEKNYEEFGKPVMSKGLMHHKFCVLDDKITITGSYNPGETSKRDNIIILNSEFVSENYLAEHEFLESKRKVKTPHEKIIFNNNTLLNYFCPRDNCTEKIINEINKANNSIKFLAFTFTDKNVANKMLEKNKTGTHIYGVIEDFQNKNEWVYPLFRNNSVFLAKTTLQHNKIIIIDDEIVITGSYNPTKAANTINNENIIIIQQRDIVEKYVEYFNYVYSFEALT